MGWMRKTFGKHWNKVIIDLGAGIVLLLINVLMAITGKAPSPEAQGSLMGIALGLLIVNGLAWWEAYQ